MTPEETWSKFLVEKVKEPQRYEKNELNKERSCLNSKLFPCDQCDHVATQKSNLERHREFIHNYEIASFYECDECKLKYTTNHALKQHNLSKHSSVRVKCDKCDYITSYKENLRNHKKAQHSGQLAPRRWTHRMSY